MGIDLEDEAIFHGEYTSFTVPPITAILLPHSYEPVLIEIPNIVAISPRLDKVQYPNKRLQHQKHLTAQGTTNMSNKTPKK